MEVYVLNKQGKPLMPCKPAIARLLLKEGKTKCIRKNPFTIKLLVDTTEHKQEVVAGMDTGSKTIGCAVIANGKVIYQSEVKIRQDVSKRWNNVECIDGIDEEEKQDTENLAGKIVLP